MEGIPTPQAPACTWSISVVWRYQTLMTQGSQSGAPSVFFRFMLYGDSQIYRFRINIFSILLRFKAFVSVHPGFIPHWKDGVNMQIAKMLILATHQASGSVICRK
ncbi:MAG: hypothetical protein K2K23_09515 [Muribaculaceae bacterium]|nr:hypothetical protein [Muribaculaceae bacterium]